MAPHALEAATPRGLARTRETRVPVDAPARERLFLGLLQEHAGRLRRIAWSYARGAERDDLFQEMLCQIWRALPGFRGESSLGTWVYRVALNTALSQVRARRRRPAEVAASEPAHPLTAGTPAREEALLEDFLGCLGEIDRSLLILYLDGLSHQEMSAVTGLSVGAVGVRISRIRRRYEERYLEGSR